jgi:group I intron endonuclease
VFIWTHVYALGPFQVGSTELRKVTPRKTWVSIAGERIDLQKEFAAISSGSVPYSVFRTRCRSAEKRSLLDRTALAMAASASQSEWIAFYGGGRARSLIYDGDAFPEQRGKPFRSISSFLTTIGHPDKHIVWDRLKRDWPLDAAISEPVVPLSERRGLIYCVTCRATGEKYVGLTVTSLATRWKRHVSQAQGRLPSGLLHRAIAAHGEAAFDLVEIETGLNSTELPNRERFWIQKLGTLAPEGLNTLRGGHASGGRGITSYFGHRKFRSREERAAMLSAETGLPQHVVATRLAAGQPLPSSARKASKHPDAGTRHWRRWKSLLKRGATRSDPISPEWLDYDRFKADTLPSFQEGLRLSRIDPRKPWSSDNFAWLRPRELVERTHGHPVSAFGRSYPSMRALAHAFGIGWTTLRDRVVNQGLAIELALLPARMQRKTCPGSSSDWNGRSEFHAAPISSPRGLYSVPRVQYECIAPCTNEYHPMPLVIVGSVIDAYNR